MYKQSPIKFEAIFSDIFLILVIVVYFDRSLAAGHYKRWATPAFLKFFAMFVQILCAASSGLVQDW